MRDSLGEIEFRNREQEFDRLVERLPPRAARSTMTFLRAPSGFGKSRLVDKVLASLPDAGFQYIVVEPEIRARQPSSRIYAWYFVQRAAAAVPQPNSGAQPSFSKFLKQSNLRRINWRGLYETGKEAYSISKLIKLAIDFAENFFGKNRFKPDAILKDESSFAVDLSRSYVEWLVKHKITILAIREAHLIDLESLRFFMNLHNSIDNVYIIFEYTSSCEFHSEHQKIVEDCRSSKSDIRIVDLVKLNKKEFLYLLRKYVRENIDEKSDEFIRWNGNLRLVREIKDHVYIESQLSDNYMPIKMVTDVRLLIYDRLNNLNNLMKLIFSIIAVHVESIPEAVLIATILRADGCATHAAIERTLAELINGTRYIRSASGRLWICDEDVASVVLESGTLIRFRVLAERTLREIYLESLSDDGASRIAQPLAFRQAIALCAATGDSAAFAKLIRTLATGAKNAHDQSMYLSLVADALLNSIATGLVVSADLVEWAAVTAYEIGNYRLSAELIESIASGDPLRECILAFCCCETDRHELGVEIGTRIQKAHSPHSAFNILAHLVQIANLFALGRKAEASRIHHALRSDPEIQNTSLYGYVLRFSELIYNFPDCTDDVVKSINFFAQRNFYASAAYSSLSAAMHLAYEGRVDDAMVLIGSAKRYLEREVRDLHIIYNNEAVVELLSVTPNYEKCLLLLENAAYGATDDFYRAVIENNRLICRWLLGQHEDARRSVEILNGVMDAPKFGNRDVFWTFTFNCFAYLREAGDNESARALMERLKNIKIAELDYEDYWNHRFEGGILASTKYKHLLKFKYHPEYLSHWLVDLDAMSDLRAGLLL